MGLHLAHVHSELRAKRFEDPEGSGGGGTLCKSICVFLTDAAWLHNGDEDGGFHLKNPTACPAGPLTFILSFVHGWLTCLTLRKPCPRAANSSSPRYLRFTSSVGGTGNDINQRQEPREMELGDRKGVAGATPSLLTH